MNDNAEKNICVIGLGYIGLPTALLFAQAKFNVIGYDIDESKIISLNSKNLYFKENGLEKLFNDVIKSHNFSASNVLPEADCYIIAVPTPTDKGKADLSYVLDSLEVIRKKISSKTLIILESTVGPTDCMDVIKPIIDSWKMDCSLVLCTERAIPGNTLYEMINNDRVIGGQEQLSLNEVSLMYKEFVKGEIFTTDLTTASVSKVMENTFRSVNIALANEFAKIAKKNGFNVWEAINLANKHPRVNIHTPGPGVGGHCIPVDPYFLLDGTRDTALIEQSLETNELMSKFVYSEVKSIIKSKNMTVKSLALLGYSYKKNVDDFRETPAESLYNVFSNDFSVEKTDPYVVRKDIKGMDEVLTKADFLIIATDHDIYQKINFSEYSNIQGVYDTRNCLSLEQKEALGEKLFILGS